MCPKFDMWESWFGSSQKYSPSSIVQSGNGVVQPGDDAEGDDRHGDEDLGSVGDAAAIGQQVDDCDGGADGRFEDAENAERQDPPSSADADGDEHSSVPPPVPRSPVSSPLGQPSPMASPLSAPSVVTGAGAAGRGRGKAASAATASSALVNVVQSKAALTAAVMNRGPLVSSPSQASSNTTGSSGSGKNTFDVVYAEAAKNKSAVMLEIAHQRSTTETQQQQSEHAFKRDERCAQQDFQKTLELQKQEVEHKFLREQQALKLLSDRQETKTKKGIEYDKTLAQLLIADNSGKLADNFESRRKRERDADVADGDPVMAFLARLIPQ